MAVNPQDFDLTTPAGRRAFLRAGGDLATAEAATQGFNVTTGPQPLQADLGGPAPQVMPNGVPDPFAGSPQVFLGDTGQQPSTGFPTPVQPKQQTQVLPKAPPAQGVFAPQTQPFDAGFPPPVPPKQQPPPVQPKRPPVQSFP